MLIKKSVFKNHAIPHMRNLLPATIILLFTSSLTDGQNLYLEKFDGCNIGSFCLDCGETKGAFKDDLTTYFSGKLTTKQLKEIDGTVLVQVLIDTTGMQCVKSIGNHATDARFVLVTLHFVCNNNYFNINNFKASSILPALISSFAAR